MLPYQMSEKGSGCFKKCPFLFVRSSTRAVRVIQPIKQITGLLLNQSHFICPSCTTSHQLFGSPDAFRSTASRLGVEVLGELPLVTGVSEGGDRGIPYALHDEGPGGRQWKVTMSDVAAKVWNAMQRS